MEAQNSITLSDITNLLECGALIRYQTEMLGQWHLVWGPFKASKEPISHGISVFCPSFYDTENDSYLIGRHHCSLSSEFLSDLLQSFLQSKAVQAFDNKLKEAAWLEPSLENYSEFFHDVQSRIQKQQIQKAVPVVFSKTSGTVTSVERAQMFLQLINAPESLYVYGFWDAEGGILGATPEVLFKFKDTKIQTMALAGTCPKVEANNGSALLEDPKERQEHELVIQDIREVLSNFGAVQVGDTKLLELPSLWHLQTDLEVQATSKFDFVELARQLHPTPALGVYPRAAGFHWMQSFADQKKRGRFGAPFMFVFPDRNEAICLVAIRNLQWNREEILLGSGAGVVAASQLNREWQELLQKRESVKKILGV